MTAPEAKRTKTAFERSLVVGETTEPEIVSVLTVLGVKSSIQGVLLLSEKAKGALDTE